MINLNLGKHPIESKYGDENALLMSNAPWKFILSKMDNNTAYEIEIKFTDPLDHHYTSNFSILEFMCNSYHT